MYRRWYKVTEGGVKANVVSRVVAMSAENGATRLSFVPTRARVRVTAMIIDCAFSAGVWAHWSGLPNEHIRGRGGKG